MSPTISNIEFPSFKWSIQYSSQVFNNPYFPMPSIAENEIEFCYLSPDSDSLKKVGTGVGISYPKWTQGHWKWENQLEKLLSLPKENKVNSACRARAKSPSEFSLLSHLTFTDTSEWQKEIPWLKSQQERKCSRKWKRPTLQIQSSKQLGRQTE